MRRNWILNRDVPADHIRPNLLQFVPLSRRRVLPLLFQDTRYLADDIYIFHGASPPSRVKRKIDPRPLHRAGEAFVSRASTSLRLAPQEFRQLRDPEKKKKIPSRFSPGEDKISTCRGKSARNFATVPTDSLYVSALESMTSRRPMESHRPNGRTRTCKVPKISSPLSLSHGSIRR